MKIKESFDIEHLKPVNLTSKSSMLYIFKILFTLVVCLVFFFFILLADSITFSIKF